jgi:lysophospholipase L1-like esterase
MTLRRFSFAAGLGAVLVAAGCNNDQLNTPAPPAYMGGAMFQRYVSIGNSITAGFQSGGINDSTQQQAYPVLVAAAMGGAPFYYPSLNYPGCPPPYTNIFTGTRVASGTATTCMFRASTPPYVSNVAVPSAQVLDAMHNGPGTGTNSNALTQLFLGGRTQYRAAVAARATFVSIWIGNNDVLGSVLLSTTNQNAGDSTLITPLATFQTRYKEMVDSLKDGLVVQGGILIGVANVTEIPYLSQGQAYLAAKLAGALPANFTVGANCAPSGSGGKGDSVLVPFPFGGALIATAAGGTPTTLTCTEPQTVQPAELRKIVTTVTQYNAYIFSLALQHAWAYLDPNPTLDSLRAIPTQVAPFPSFGAPCSASPFGLAFSCDGFHPSASAHRLIAQHVVRAINSSYISAIPAVP